MKALSYIAEEPLGQALTILRFFHRATQALGRTLMRLRFEVVLWGVCGLAEAEKARHSWPEKEVQVVGDVSATRVRCAMYFVVLDGLVCRHGVGDQKVVEPAQTSHHPPGKKPAGDITGDDMRGRTLQ